MNGLATLKYESIFNLTKVVIKQFSGEIKTRRKRKGMTVKELSELANVSISQINGMERGRVGNVSLYVLLQISKPLDYYDWLNSMLNPKKEKSEKSIENQLQIFKDGTKH